MKSNILNPKEWLAAFTEKTRNSHLVYAEALNLAIKGAHKDGIKGLKEFHISQGSAYQKGQTYAGFLPRLQKPLKSSNSEPLQDKINSIAKENTLSDEALFKRDGFHCRYSGIKLLDIRSLDLLSLIYPSVFPLQHINWKSSLTHVDVWMLSSTREHKIPKSRFTNGSPEVASNLLTASGAINMLYKKAITLEELGWNEIPIESLDNNWDGLNGKVQAFDMKYGSSFYQDASGRRNQFQRIGYPSEYADNWAEFPFRV